MWTGSHPNECTNTFYTTVYDISYACDMIKNTLLFAHVLTRELDDNFSELRDTLQNSIAAVESASYTNLPGSTLSAFAAAKWLSATV